jgi:hypothetical protein
VGKMNKKNDLLETVLKGTEPIPSGLRAFDDLTLGGLYMPVHIIKGYARNVWLWQLLKSLIAYDNDNEIYKCYFSSTKSPRRMLADLLPALQKSSVTLGPRMVYKNGLKNENQIEREAISEAAKVYETIEDYVTFVGGRYGSIMDIDEEVDREAPIGARVVVLIEDINRSEGEYGNLQDIGSNNNAIVVAIMGESVYFNKNEIWEEEADIVMKLRSYEGVKINHKAWFQGLKNTYYPTLKSEQNKEFVVNQITREVHENEEGEQNVD